MATLTLNRATVVALESSAPVVALESSAPVVALESSAPVVALESSAPANELQRANMDKETNVTLAQVECEYSDVKGVKAYDATQDASKVILCRILLRACVAHALHASPLRLDASSLKGAMLNDKARQRVLKVAPECNGWVNNTIEWIMLELPELATQLMGAINGDRKVSKPSPELERARKYLKTLSIETLTALRAEGSI